MLTSEETAISRYLLSPLPVESREGELSPLEGMTVSMAPSMMTRQQHLGRTLRQGGARIGLLVVGLLSLAWFLFRSGTKPSRAVYPCQRASISVAHVALGTSALALSHHLLHRLGWRLRRSTQLRLLVAILVIASAAFLGSRLWSRAAEARANGRLDASWEQQVVAMAGTPLALTSSVTGNIPGR